MRQCVSFSYDKGRLRQKNRRVTNSILMKRMFCFHGTAGLIATGRLECHCLVGNLSSREGGKGWTDHPTTLCFGLHDLPSGASHDWRQSHVQMNREYRVTLISAGGTYKWPDRQTQGEKLWKKLSDAPALTTLCSPLFYCHQTLNLRSCSQSTKVSKKWQYLLEESIGVGHKPGIKRKLGMDFQGAPEMAEML